MPQRRLLVACGAGMAAVYNVPIGGALIAAEILYGSIRLPVVLPASVCAWVATVTGWLYLPVHQTYTALIVPIIAAAAGVTLIAHYVDGYSIYSAQLPRSGEPGSPDGHDAGDEPARRMECA